MTENNQLRIMTYNVKNAMDVPPHSWEERKGMLRDLIQRESPDLIGTQECLYGQVCDILEMLPEYDWIGLGREGGSRGEYAAIFFKKERFKILEYDHFWLSDTPDVIASATWGNFVTRMMTWAQFVDVKTNLQFYHMNTHFDHESSNSRVKSAKTIIQMIDQFDPNLPIILTGDFNEDINSKPYEVLLSEGALSDTWNMTNLRFNEELGTFNDFQDPHGGKERIDWIIVRGDMIVESVGIIADHPNGCFPSDHYPVVANVYLK
ncbi:endonuclease/exonuclease/phosphatase family protein [Bacillus sp. EB106-08-02-XG196]|jgi:endonuclease/exonuclease/phosphatase family metal-dependent hydrolase|uniref:endonuclease/exonuclease/phosphatase family protein n=1 Tax=Bacillus sp. EB106-08-02-XG196 TaxID=2737049 RepID=UPI0015C4A89D|nr:endonuclease/exonuclease/phosphatase family protein [Bacillus sp. EB106-08-02-XG196]NWQ40748.1 endonuclease/exonuclease/phosphatase family protein [Bacillus sp. EB106-08-02-XG196]